MEFGINIYFIKRVQRITNTLLTIAGGDCSLIAIKQVKCTEEAEKSYNLHLDNVKDKKITMLLYLDLNSCLEFLFYLDLVVSRKQYRSTLMQ